MARREPLPARAPTLLPTPVDGALSSPHSLGLQVTYAPPAATSNSETAKPTKAHI